MINCEIIPCIDGDWGEVHDFILKDAVTQARWEYSEFGARIALRNIPALKELIENSSWRAAEAADIMATIIRVALAEDIIVVERVTEDTPW